MFNTNIINFYIFKLLFTSQLSIKKYYQYISYFLHNQPIYIVDETFKYISQPDLSPCLTFIDQYEGDSVWGQGHTSYICVTLNGQCFWLVAATYKIILRHD
jgi:hypothetical protein